MFDVRYKGFRIALSLSAMNKLADEIKDMDFVLKILENGYDALRKRKEGTIEKWLDKGNKTFNAVIAKDYDEIMKEDI